jgi:GNAT superfamily N-acetyltransferase
VTSTAAVSLRRLDRAAVQPFLQQLGDWLLPDAYYGVHHTWPQLYRSDGDGRFLGMFAGDRLLSHCAFRCATVRTAAGTRPIALLGSVATDSAERGRGLASRLLAAAIDDCRAEGAEAVLLWAERPELYARAGFVPGAAEQCATLTRPCAADGDEGGTVGGGVRLATIADHARLCALHARKPTGIVRSERAMSALLTTPGMWTCVLERDAEPVAYACTGKGADLQNWWHEVGGTDMDVATLLPRAMTLVGQPQSIVLLPPYRAELARRLDPHGLGTTALQGPMVLRLGSRSLPSVWIDGLDSV